MLAGVDRVRFVSVKSDHGDCSSATAQLVAQLAGAQEGEVFFAADDGMRLPLLDSLERVQATVGDADMVAQLFHGCHDGAAGIAVVANDQNMFFHSDSPQRMLWDADKSIGEYAVFVKYLPTNTNPTRAAESRGVGRVGALRSGAEQVLISTRLCTQKPHDVGFLWCAWQDSNLRPPAPQADALSN